MALRDAYATVVGVDVFDPSGHDANLHEDPTFTRDLFGLKINQGGGSFRPYSERIYFLNCMISILPQMLDMVPKEGDTKKGLWTSLTDWIGPNSFGGVKKLLGGHHFSPTRKAASRRSLRAKLAVQRAFGLASLSHSVSTPPQRWNPHSTSALEMGS